jgi:hypothetical protein
VTNVSSALQQLRLRSRQVWPTVIVNGPPGELRNILADVAFDQGYNYGGQRMRRAHVFAIAIAIAGSAALSLPASADRICRQDCVGPLCKKECVHRDRDITVGRGVRDRDVVIEERRRVREPGVEIRRSRPGVDIDVR